MAEIKRTFTTARMNKDLDERLIPNGEYRDAMNIQIRTTDGDAAGTIQNIQGNTPRYTSTLSNFAGMKVVGSVADERNNKAYYFLASPDFVLGQDNDTPISSFFTNTHHWCDSIVEVSDDQPTGKEILIDNFAITEVASQVKSGANIAASGSTTISGLTNPAHKYRVGMQLTAYNASDFTTECDPLVVTGFSDTQIFFDRPFSATITSSMILIWRHPRMLNFNQNTLITGINVIDEYLFFTTNDSEPKKINIRRATKGTEYSSSTAHKHTKNFIDSPQGLVFAKDGYDGLSFTFGPDLLEEHITVMKKAPKSAPVLVMSDTLDPDELVNFTFANKNIIQYSGAQLINVGDTFNIGNPGGGSILLGSTYSITCLNSSQEPKPSAVVEVVDVNYADEQVSLKLISRDASVTVAHTNWEAKLLSDLKGLFELKFARFGTRYKYNDDEYSSFSPFSEVAFMPGKFEYNTMKGFNLGMVNQLKTLSLKNIIPSNVDDLPQGVKAIDILYKSTDSPVVYVVKTIDKDYGLEWPEVNDPDFAKTNTIEPQEVKIKITTDMVHKAVPNDQILRSWDNVPRFAKSQEIVANRLAYGNYTQGYDLNFNVAINERFIKDDILNYDFGKKSIKSLRSYKVGVVYGDALGRETPVIISGHSSITTNSTSIESSDSSVLPKSAAPSCNKIAVKQTWNLQGSSQTVPSWIDYVKYYVKETSNEYYNLVLDRWYDADDGNSWLSFASADRNKVDEQTYLILKNEHGNNYYVPEEGRYKILAIENEAPEYIKQDNWIVSEKTVTDSDSSYNDDNEPEKLMTGVNFELSSAVSNTDFRGTPTVRIKAMSMHSDGILVKRTLYTQYKYISKISLLSSEFNISQPWGEAANFPNLFVSYGDYSDLNAATTGIDQIKYEFEFRDQVIVNKPEFEGRFFVKVQKDNTLRKRVFKLGNENYSYSPVKYFKFGYIQSDFDNPDSNSTINFNDGIHGSTSGVIVGNNPDPQTNPVVFNNVFGLPNFVANPGGVSVLGENKTRLFWETFASNNSPNQTGVFIDGANSPGFLNGFEVWAADSTSNNYGDQEYDNMLYNTLEGSDLQQFSEFGSDRGFAFSGYAGVASNTFDRLFFSVAKVEGVTGSRFEGDSLDFKETMMTEGTRFRFSTDPNQVVYEVIPEIFGEPNNNTTGEVNTVMNYGPGFQSSTPLQTEDNPYDWYSTTKNRASFYTTFRRVQNNILTNSGINVADWDPRGTVIHDGSEHMQIEILETIETYDGTLSSNSLGAVFETEPKEDVDLDIYYEASSAIPMRVSEHNTRYFAPVKSKVEFFDPTTNQKRPVDSCEVTRSHNGVVEIKRSSTPKTLMTETDIAIGDIIRFTHEDGTITTSTIDLFVHSSFVTTGAIINNAGTRTGYYLIDRNVHQNEVQLNWSNCISFGNGVESDRIRDDFNAFQLDNGVKVSTTLLDYKKEVKYNSIIYSNIFNPNGGINGLNEFNMSQRITKDLNPAYGSIQALKTRDTDLITFTEDKVLRILANKDALFNADGNTNLTASDRVLGQAVPYVGDYGISTNPESLAVDQFRMYFTDKQRGAVLRLSRDGLTPISNVGMRTYFRDNLAKADNLIGSFDTVNDEYNLTIKFDPSQQVTDTTVAFNETNKGWVSFRSFVADTGLSVGGKYFTGKTNAIYEHHVDNNIAGGVVGRNVFYNTFRASDITFVFNSASGSVKNFKTLNYEGTQAYQQGVNDFNFTDVTGQANSYTDNSYSNVTSVASNSPGVLGWRTTNIKTDLDSGAVNEFTKKEGKWFGKICGEFETSSPTVDESSISTQGLGVPQSVSNSDNTTEFNLTIEEDE
jgi:hypothetical protein